MASAASASGTLFKSVKGLVTLVTGGASGLGKATIDRLHQRGAKIALMDTVQSRGEEVVKHLGSQAIYTPADVTSEQQVKSAIDQVKQEFGRLDVILNAAGVAYGFKLYNKNKHEICPLDRIQKTMDINVVGMMNVMRYGVALMTNNEPDEQNQRGVIVNVSSVSAYDGQMLQSAYSASKGAVASMTLPLARDFADSGIRVMSIAPGVFDTPMVQAELNEEMRQALASVMPNPSRLGNPEEFAALVEHIIVNRYLNGEVIRLDAASYLALHPLTSAIAEAFD